MSNFVDTVQLGGTRLTRDGYLTAQAKVARTGIQTYAGWEVGKPAMERVNVYRPEASVFAKDSMASFVGKPITDNHPDEIVNSENWKDYAKGQIGEEIARDGESIRISLALMDKALIDKVQSGTRELSVGYRAELEWADGVAPDGTAYNAIQKDIFVDHVAVVPKGRAGSDFRIGDNANDSVKERKKWGIAPIITNDENKETPLMADNLTTVVLGDKAVQISAGDVSVLETYKKDTAKQIADAEQSHATAIAAKDAELAQKDAEIDDLKSKVLSDADIDVRVSKRAKLIDTARIIAKNIKTDGLSDADIRRAAVVAAKGDDAIKDKSEAYVEAMFDVLATSAGNKNDTVRDAFKGANVTIVVDAVTARDTALAERNADLAKAWKGK